MTTSELGNTNTNSQQKQRTRGWCFTLNNYSDEEYEILKYDLTNKSIKFVIGKEIGEQGTPHLQGYCYFKNKHSFQQMKKINDRCHWEVAKGSPEANLSYCTKSDESAVQNGFAKKITLQEEIKDRLLKKYDNVKWKSWQNDVLNVLETMPDSRTINWVYDPIGNSGKSFLVKYIALVDEIIIADGKKDNIFHQVLKKINEEEKEFRTVILDIPRSSEGYINYGVLEQLKNGLMYSGKYEGGMCLFDDIHVFVFANFKPDYNQFSSDRWNVIEIREDNLVNIL